MSSGLRQLLRSIEDSAHNAVTVSVLPDIVFSTLQAVEEAEELIAGLITDPSASGRCCFGERVLFHHQRRLQIDLRRLHRLMSEPQGTHRTIDARLEKFMAMVCLKR